MIAWVALAVGSILLFVYGVIQKIFRGLVRRLEEKAEEARRKQAPTADTNWYDKASLICADTIDALLNTKPGTSARIISGLAAKLGSAGATAGLFTIASAFGTASTGTAISTLSGAAFNSAALKWLGGGVSMAAGGWVVAIISMIVWVIVAIFARRYLRRIYGAKRKFKDLDDQEKRVIDTLTLLAVSFRKQSEKQRRIDPTSAAILHDKVFAQILEELQVCLEKAGSWPAKPRNRIKQHAARMSELGAFLGRMAPSGRKKAAEFSGAERVDIVTATILKLMSSPVPPLSTQEKLVLEAIRLTNKRKFNKVSLEILSDYLRSERIGGLLDKIKKVARKYRKLAKRNGQTPFADEYTVAILGDEELGNVDVLMQNVHTGEVSFSSIARSGDSQSTQISNNSKLIGDTDPDDILETLSAVAVITVAKCAGSYLRGRPVSRREKDCLLEDGYVKISVEGLSQIFL